MDSSTRNEIEEVPETQKSEIEEEVCSKVNVPDEQKELPETKKSEIQEGGGLKVNATDEIEEVPTTEKSDIQEEGSSMVNATASAIPDNVPGKAPGSISSKDKIFRADKIDLKSLDIQLERHLSRAWSSKKVDPQKPKEIWEIDLAKLDIKRLVARGTYGTIYRGTYDNQDVAGTYVSISGNLSK